MAPHTRTALFLSLPRAPCLLPARLPLTRPPLSPSLASRSSTCRPVPAARGERGRHRRVAQGLPPRRLLRGVRACCRAPPRLSRHHPAPQLSPPPSTLPHMHTKMHSILAHRLVPRQTQRRPCGPACLAPTHAPRWPASPAGRQPPASHATPSLALSAPRFSRPPDGPLISHTCAHVPHALRMPLFFFLLLSAAALIVSVSSFCNSCSERSGWVVVGAASGCEDHSRCTTAGSVRCWTRSSGKSRVTISSRGWQTR